MGGDTPTYDVSPDPVYGFVDFVGELFLWGLVGASAVHFDKGLRGSPSGGARLAGAVNAVRQNAPRVAGKFGTFAVVLANIESAVSFATGRDDTWSAAAAVATTCGLYGMRWGGASAAAPFALLGATGFLGVDYAGRVWVKSKAKATNRSEPIPVFRRPEPARGVGPLWLRMLPPFGTREKDHHGAPELSEWNR